MRRGTPRRVLRRGRVIAASITPSPVAAPNGEIFGTPQLRRCQRWRQFRHRAECGLWCGGRWQPPGWAMGGTLQRSVHQRRRSVALVFDNTMFAVTIKAPVRGTVTPIGVARDTFGSYVNFTAVPDPGYRASAQTTPAGQRFHGRRQPVHHTASLVTADCSITVSFYPPSRRSSPSRRSRARMAAFRRPRRSRLHTGRTYRADGDAGRGLRDCQRHRLRRHAEQQWQVRDRGGEPGELLGDRDLRAGN